MTALTVRSSRNQRLDWLQKFVFSLTFLATVVVCVPVAVVSVYVISHGASAISWEFLFSGPARAGREGGFFPVIVLTMYALLLVMLFAVPVGVLCSIYLAEYAQPGRLLRLINLTIINLAGVPSIVYGLFGAALFFDVIQLTRGVAIDHSGNTRGFTGAGCVEASNNVLHRATGSVPGHHHGQPTGR